MKKLKYLILLLLLLPMTVYAKTPNKEETIKVIETIENVQVDDGIIIYNISFENGKMILNLSNNGVSTKQILYYTFDDEKLSFKGGKYEIDPNTKELKELGTNDYAFYLYAILENKSSIPYNIDNYYNNNNIKEKLKEFKENKKVYIEDTKTFGITLEREKTDFSEYINVSYQYYFTGDYPVMIKEETTDKLTNPATGNYSLAVTIVLIFVLGIGIYTCIDPKKE